MADNVKELKNFINEIAVEIDNFERDAEKVIKESVISAHGTIVTLSPVDTGRYKASNYISERVESNEVTSENENFNAKIEEQTKNVEGKLENISYFITNNLEYAESIEGGHSQQAPNGVYAPASNITRRIIDRLILRLNSKRYK